jgi:hypothetical protein
MTIREAKRIAESLGVRVCDVSFGSRHVVLHVVYNGRRLGVLRMHNGNGGRGNSDPREYKFMRGRVRSLIRGTNRIGART